MPDRPRAIFVWSDLDAIPILNAAKMAGIRVPEDLAIVGYDNSPVAALPLIGLASMDQDPLRLGALATRTLLSRIGGRTAAEHIMIEPQLICRNSFRASVSWNPDRSPQVWQNTFSGWPCNRSAADRLLSGRRRRRSGPNPSRYGGW